jgi:hypothetical protein
MHVRTTIRARGPHRGQCAMVDPTTDPKIDPTADPTTDPTTGATAAPRRSPARCRPPVRPQPQSRAMSTRSARARPRAHRLAATAGRPRLEAPGSASSRAALDRCHRFETLNL